MSEESGFKIERKTSAGGTYAQIDTVPANQATYSDTTVEEGTEYFYRVRAFNSAGNSTYSNEASATTPSSPAARVVRAVAQIKKTANQETTTGNEEEVDWSAEVFDTGSLWSSGNAFVIPADFNGKYAQVICCVRWEANVVAGSQQRMLRVLKNGVEFPGSSGHDRASSGSLSRTNNLVITPPVQVATGDEFTIQALQRSNTTIDILQDANTFFQIIILDTFSGALLSKSAVQEIANNTPEVLTWDVANVDTDNFWSASTPSRITIPSGVSRVRFYAGARWEALGTAGPREIAMLKDSATFDGAPKERLVTTANVSDQAMNCMVSPVMEVEEGDIFEIQATQTNGSSSACDILNEAQTYFAVEVLE
jgi:hypothetical protein